MKTLLNAKELVKKCISSSPSGRDQLIHASELFIPTPEKLFRTCIFSTPSGRDRCVPWYRTLVLTTRGAKDTDSEQLCQWLEKKLTVTEQLCSTTRGAKDTRLSGETKSSSSLLQHEHWPGMKKKRKQISEAHTTRGAKDTGSKELPSGGTCTHILYGLFH